MKVQKITKCFQITKKRYLGFITEEDPYFKQ